MVFAQFWEILYTTILSGTATSQATGFRLANINTSVTITSFRHQCQLEMEVWEYVVLRRRHLQPSWHQLYPYSRDLRIVFCSFELNRQSDLFSNRIGRIFNPSVFCICDERVMYKLRNSELSTCLFLFSHKTRQTMLLYAYFTPKVNVKCKFNHQQSFLYEWRLTVRTIRKFRIKPSIRIESRIGCMIRNRIESRSFAGPYHTPTPINYSPCQHQDPTGLYHQTDSIHTGRCSQLIGPHGRWTAYSEGLRWIDHSKL